jgi:thiamine phosphate synthase YjbQ (UPF0047 family)
MKSTTEYLTFNVPSRRGFVNITSQIDKIVQKVVSRRAFV